MVSFSYISFNRYTKTLPVIECNEYIKSRSVFIGNLRGNGTGVILNSKHILTAAHVVADDKMIFVHTYHNHIGYMKVLYKSKEADFAIIAAIPNQLDPIKIQRTPENNESLCVVGNPVERPFVSANPSVIGLSWWPGPDMEMKKYLMYSGRGVKPGFSGGGLFNAYNELLGIVNFCSFNNLICGGVPIHLIELELSQTEFKLN